MDWVAAATLAQQRAPRYVFYCLRLRTLECVGRSLPPAAGRTPSLQAAWFALLFCGALSNLE
jgi:hypothetical protein